MAQSQIFCKELNLQHDCEYFQGWLHKLKLRHGIIFIMCAVNRKSADTEAGEKFVG
jgi:hypothetical protein